MQEKKVPERHSGLCPRKDFQDAVVSQKYPCLSEIQTVSEISETNPMLRQLITQEDFIA
jgi:hypothetical protein